MRNKKNIIHPNAEFGAISPYKTSRRKLCNQSSVKNLDFEESKATKENDQLKKTKHSIASGRDAKASKKTRSQESVSAKREFSTTSPCSPKQLENRSLCEYGKKRKKELFSQTESSNQTTNQDLSKISPKKNRISKKSQKNICNNVGKEFSSSSEMTNNDSINIASPKKSSKRSRSSYESTHSLKEANSNSTKIRNNDKSLNKSKSHHNSSPKTLDVNYNQKISNIEKVKHDALIDLTSPKPKTESRWISKETIENLTSKKKPNKKKKIVKTESPQLKRTHLEDSDDFPCFTDKNPPKKVKYSKSFQKYGILVPSVKDLIKDKKNLSIYKKQVKKVTKIKEPTEILIESPQPASPNKILLDCKDLTLDQLSTHFHSNKHILRDIMNGKIACERHNRYHKKVVYDILSKNHLAYNTSTIVFSFEQIDHTVALMEKEFDKEQKQTSYFFKVLVPEFCLRVFMETHKMNRKTAEAYLEKRPVE